MLAFWEQDDLSYACLYPQKHFVPPSFVFFCFSPRQIGSGPTKRMVQKVIGCEDPRDCSMSEKQREIMPNFFFFVHTLFSHLLFVVAQKLFMP